MLCWAGLAWVSGPGRCGGQGCRGDFCFRAAFVRGGRVGEAASLRSMRGGFGSSVAVGRAGVAVMSVVLESVLQRIKYRLLDPQPADPAARKWLNPATPAENKRNARLKPKLRPYNGQGASEYEKWATGWTFLNRPVNTNNNARKVHIEYPNKLYATPSQAIKAWKTEHAKGKIKVFTTHSEESNFTSGLTGPQMS